MMSSSTSHTSKITDHCASQMPNDSAQFSLDGQPRKETTRIVGMLQILTYLLAFYLVVKGVEVLQIALASPRQDRSGIITWGVLVLGACIIAAVIFVAMQDHQASSIGSHNSPEYRP